MKAKKTVQAKRADVKLLGLDQVSERLGLSAWTIRRWAQQGRIASVKLSNRLLIPEYVVDEIINRNLRPADAPDSIKV